jgi:hypothetical protein
MAGKKLVEKALQAVGSEAAKKRAAELGYDTSQVWYHSTLAPIEKFEPTGKFMGRSGLSGIHLTDNPAMANRYLERYGEIDYKGDPFQKNVMPVYVKTQNVLERNEPFQSNLPLGAPIPEGYQNPLPAMGYDALLRDEAINARGGVKHVDPSARGAITGKELVLTDPSQLRSIYDEYFRGGAVEREHHSGGELVGKALRAVMGSRADKYVADPAQRAANLARWQAKTPKEVTDPTWYHGTFTDVESLRPGSSDATFLSKDPEFANRFATTAERGPSHDWDAVNKVWVSRESLPSAPNVMPFHVRAENPFDYENPQHIEALDRLMQERFKTDPHMRSPIPDVARGGWMAIESTPIQDALKQLGHDAFFVMEDGYKNLAVYDPTRQLKSATGNLGTFDPNIERLTEADGGAVEREHHADGERVAGEVRFDPRELVVPPQFRAIPQDTGISIGGDGKTRLGEVVNASLVPTINAGPISGGPMLVGVKDFRQPIVGYQASAALPEGFSASYSSSRPLDVPSKYSDDTLSLAKEILGMQVAAQLQKQGDRSGYGVSLSKGDNKGQSYLSVSRPSSGGIAVMGGKAFRFADGGEVYQSTGEKLVDDGKINWGDPNEARDFFRADAEMMRRIKEEEAAKNTTTVMPSGVTAYAPVGGGMTSNTPLLAAIRGQESSDDPNAQSKTSTSGGLFGFIDSTWINTLRRMDPERYGRMSDAELLALKKGRDTAALQQQAADYHLNQEIAPTLAKANIPLTPGNAYLGWFQGAQGAVRANTLPPDARVADVFPKSVEPNARIRFNGKPYADWTIADLRAWADATMAKRMGRAEGGEVDDALHIVREHHADGDAVGTSRQRMRATLDMLDRNEPRPAVDPAVEAENRANAIRRFRENPLRADEAFAYPVERSVRDIVGGMIAGDQPNRSYATEVRRRAADLLVGSTGLPDSGTVGFGVADLPRVTGIPLQVADVAHSLQEGDYVGAAANTLLPAALLARKPIADAGRRAVEIAREYVPQYSPQMATAAGAAALLSPDEAQAAKAPRIKAGDILPRTLSVDEIKAAYGPQALQGVSPEDLPRLIDAYSKIATPHSPGNILPQFGMQTAEAYRPKTGYDTSSGSYFNVKPSVPKEATTTVETPFYGPTPKTPVQETWDNIINRYYGSPMISIGGDRSDFKTLYGINQDALARPTRIHAGFKYMLEPNPGEIWGNAAAHSGAYEALYDKLKGAMKSDRPVLGVAAPMGPQSIDSSRDFTNLLLSGMEGRGINPTDLKAFTQYLTSGEFFPTAAKREAAARVMEGFPGFENFDKAREFLLDPRIPGTIRREFAQSMDKAAWRDRGFPEVGSYRLGATDPYLRDVPANMIGGRLVEIDPKLFADAKQNKIFEHFTYPSSTYGRYVADVPFVQRHYAMPEATQELLLKYNQVRPPLKKGGDDRPPLIVHPFSTETTGSSTARKMFEEQKQVQELNDIMRQSIQFGEARRGDYGYQEGGSVEDRALEVIWKRGSD